VLATGSRDGSVTLWNLRGSNPLRFVHATERDAAKSKDDEDVFDWRPRSPAAGAKVILKTSKPQHFGEEIDVQFECSPGKRLWSFQPVAIAPHGISLPCRGHSFERRKSGRSASAADVHGRISHGDLFRWKHSQTLDLLAYRRLEKPGTYQFALAWRTCRRAIEIRGHRPRPRNCSINDAAGRRKEAPSSSSPPIEGLRIDLPPSPRRTRRAGSRGAIDILARCLIRGTQALLEVLNNPDPKLSPKQESLYLRLPDPLLEGNCIRGIFR
jgi:hypothetical protein